MQHSRPEGDCKATGMGATTLSNTRKPNITLAYESLHCLNFDLLIKIKGRKNVSRAVSNLIKMYLYIYILCHNF